MYGSLRVSFARLVGPISFCSDGNKPMQSTARAYCGQPLNLGQYGIEISQVPLPRPFWLLGTGGIALWIVGRGRTSN